MAIKNIKYNGNIVQSCELDRKVYMEGVKFDFYMEGVKMILHSHVGRHYIFFPVGDLKEIIKLHSKSKKNSII